MLLVLLVAGLAVGFACAQRAPVARRPPPARRRRARRARARSGRRRRARSRCPRRASAARSPTAGRTSPTRTRRQPANDPDRLTAVGSVRARYWNEALKIAKAAQGRRRRRRRLRDRAPALSRTTPSTCATPTATSCRRWPTSALVGARLNLALLAAWLAAATRTIGLWGRAGARRGRPSGSAWSRCWPSASSSACTRSWTGRGSCPATPSSRCCARAGWPAADLTNEPTCASRCAAADAVREPVADRAGPSRRWPSPWWPRGRRSSPSARSPRAPTRSSTAEALHLTRRARRSPAPSAPTRCRSTCSSAGARSSAPTATTAGARASYEEAVRNEPANPATWLAPGEFELERGPQAAGRSRPSARPSTSTRARRRPSDLPAGPTRAAARPSAAPTPRSGPRRRPTRRRGQEEDQVARASAGDRVERATQERHAADGADRARRRTRVGQDLPQRARGEEAQMIGARIEVRVGGRPEPRRPSRPGVVTSSRPPHRSTRRTSASSPTTSATCSSTSPAHTTSTASSASGSGAPSDSCRRRRPARARGRAAAPARDVGHDDVAPGVPAARRRTRRRRAEVEHTLPADVVEQERAARREPLRPASSGTARHTASRQAASGAS